MKDMLALFDGYLIEQGSDSEGYALHKLSQELVFFCSFNFRRSFITPLAIFSDDISGNLTKTHGMYSNMLVNFPAISYSMRNRRKNNFFVTAVSQQARFKLTHLMPIQATDLKALENGVDMYSSTYDETITVCASLLFITANNAQHTELVGLKHLTSNFLCKRCYSQNLSRFGFDNFGISLFYPTESLNFENPLR
ncbi:hypothetical protein J3Q64DRAFT_1837616 [Phycomyces blakesleeanus]|uniref:HNH nuclease domain-containing protein n=1 Tax=Phycomyces blakesleeanus TaxID=4837 RepID=A0ABR3ATV2_PHYBL